MEGYHALHISVSQHQSQVTKLLVETQTEWGRRAKHITSSGHNYSTTSSGGMERSRNEARLPQGDAKFATPTASGHTALHFAVAVNNMDSLFLLLKHHRVMQLNVDCQGCGYSPLHLAVYLSQNDSVRMLLTKGANPNNRLDETTANAHSICRTPLAGAVFNRNVEIVNILLQYGAEDRHHDALKLCVPYDRHRDLVLPLLASLVVQDGTQKPPKPYPSSISSRKHKPVVLQWEGISLTEVLPNWVTGCLPMVHALNMVERSRLRECVTTVNLTNNQLRSVPVELFHLPKMAVLNLTGNLLECLPEIDQVDDSFVGGYHWPCFSLSKLHLSKNELRTLPEFIFSLPQLTHLELSHNHLRELPFDLWHTPKLHTLLCTHNEIECIPTNWPRVLSSCTVVNISPKAMMEVCVERAVLYSMVLE